MQIAQQTLQCDEETARARVNSLLAPHLAMQLDNREEEITCDVSPKLKLMCPLSFERCVTPVRGEACMHVQCFDLQAYHEINTKMRALNNRWTCPICYKIIQPQDLRVDGYVKRVLSETPSYIEEVMIMQNGSYRCIEKAHSDKAPILVLDGNASQAAQAARVPPQALSQTPMPQSPAKRRREAGREEKNRKEAAGLEEKKRKEAARLEEKQRKEAARLEEKQRKEEARLEKHLRQKAARLEEKNRKEAIRLEEKKRKAAARRKRTQTTRRVRHGGSAVRRFAATLTTSMSSEFHAPWLMDDGDVDPRWLN